MYRKIEKYHVLHRKMQNKHNYIDISRFLAISIIFNENRMLLLIATTLRIKKLNSFKRDDVGIKSANLSWDNAPGYKSLA